MIAFFLANRWSQYALGGILILTLFGAVLWKVYRAGEEKGEQTGSQKATEQIEQLHAQDKAVTDAKLRGFAEKLADLEADGESKAKETLRWASLASSIAQERSQAHQAIVSTPDYDLDRLIKQKLGRKEGFESPLSYGEQREIAACLVDKPLCEQENQKLKGQIESQNGEIVTAKESIATGKEQFETLKGYNSRLEGYYVQMYNAYPHKYRHWKCAGIWKCGNRKLPTPKLEEMK